MVNTNSMFLVYQDSEGRQFSQHWEDLTESGTLIDPETGEDLELVGWHCAVEYNGSNEPNSPQRIAWELERTADGSAYFGNALKVAKNMPQVTDEDRALLDRWLTGNQGGLSDFTGLSELANRIAAGKAAPAKATPANIRDVALEAAEAFIKGLGGGEGADDLLDLIRLAKRAGECEEARLFAIARQDEPVFWSNTQGWVDVISCDLFTAAEVESVRLPLEGRWVRLG